MEFETKYYGILKEFNFDKINIDSFKILLSQNIFDEKKLSKCYENDEDYFAQYHYTMEFGDFFIHNRKEYHLKKDIYSEMIYVKNWHLEAFNEVSVLTDEIEIKIASEFNLENKLNILEENFKKYFGQIKNKNYYSLFKNEISTNGYDSWKQYFISDITDNENFKSITKFLNGDYKFLNNEIENQWNDYFIFSKISDYCENKKNSLLNITPNIIQKNKNSNHLSYKMAVIEYIEILKVKDEWNELTNPQKGRILGLFLDHHWDNIRKYYDELEHTLPAKKEKDRIQAENDIKEILQRKKK